MTESTWITWRDSLYFLRSLSTVPAALANATTLLAATPQWSQRLVARTSVHDLLFTLPSDDYPFRSQVRVQWAAGTSTILRWQNDTLAEETNAEADNVDRVLDAVLERLATPALICRRCHRPVVVSAEQFEIFERMHYSCFHYEFEHDPFDPDEECTAGGCPAAVISPASVPEEPRDSLVEELIDDLVASELGEQAADVHIHRLGPGILDARFDQHDYLITVRTKPRSRS